MGPTFYQYDWLTTPRYVETKTGTKARIKAFIKARRVGGSFAAGIDAANICIGYCPLGGGSFTTDKPADVFVVSRTHEQSKRFLKDIADWIQRASQADPVYQCEVKAETITFASTGKQIVALACNADSLRGKTGAVIWDECAFAERQEEVWASLAMIAAPNLSEPRGYPVQLITTPWAAGSFAHKLINGEIPGVDYVLRVDIYDAIRAGFPITVEDARRRCATEEIFLTEYCCQWLKGLGSFFDVEALTASLSEGLPDEVRKWPAYWGIDLGATHDRTALVQVRRSGNDVWVSSIRSLKGIHTDDQLERIAAVLKSESFASCYIDRGGLGLPMVQHLERRFPKQVKGIQFSAPLKEQMAVAARTLIDKSALRIYTGGSDKGQEARSLIQELATISAKPTSAGRLTFETPRDAGGHGDRAWAFLLAVNASEKGRPYVSAPTPVIIDPDSRPLSFG